MADDMQPLGNPLDVIVRQAERMNPEQADDYIGSDGLLYCGKCHTKKQTRVQMTMLNPPGERVFPVPCKCRQEEIDRQREMEEKTKEMERLKKLRDSSLMDAKFRESTFQSFVQTKNNARVLKLCRRYAEGFDEMYQKNQGLLLWGGFGTGKTYAAACIANYLLERMVPVVMTSFVKILQNVQSFRNDDEERRFISLMNRAKLLIIDDLGTERNTDFALEKVYNIIWIRLSASSRSSSKTKTISGCSSLRSPDSSTSSAPCSMIWKQNAPLRRRPGNSLMALATSLF